MSWWGILVLFFFQIRVDYEKKLILDELGMHFFWFHYHVNLAKQLKLNDVSDDNDRLI